MAEVNGEQFKSGTVRLVIRGKVQSKQHTLIPFWAFLEKKLCTHRAFALASKTLENLQAK